MLTQQNLSKVRGAPPQATYQCGVYITTKSQWSFETWKSSCASIDAFLMGWSYGIVPSNLAMPESLKGTMTAENWRIDIAEPFNAIVDAASKKREEVVDVFKGNPYVFFWTRFRVFWKRRPFAFFFCFLIVGFTFTWPLIIIIFIVADCCVIRRNTPAEIEWITHSANRIPHLDGIAVESEMATQLQALAEKISRRYPSIRVVYWNGIEHRPGGSSVLSCDFDEFYLLFYLQQPATPHTEAYV
jgi:hypothetical protein